MFTVSFISVSSGSLDMRVCRADSEAVRTTVFLSYFMVFVVFSSAGTSAL